MSHPAPQTQRLAHAYVRAMRIAASIALALTAWASPVNANVVVSTTRAIVPVPPGHASIRLTNTSPAPALVQIWADSGDGASTPDTGDAPFEITPPLFVLGAKESQVVRIDYEDDPASPLPASRESLYWLNVLDIPSTSESTNASNPTNATNEREPFDPAGEATTSSDRDDPKEKAQTTPPNSDADDNALRFVVHTRIKLIARPRGLDGTALNAPGKLVWRLDDGHDDSVATTQPGIEAVKSDAVTADAVNTDGVTTHAHHTSNPQRAPSPQHVAKLIGTNTTPFYVTCAPLFVVGADRRERTLGTHAIAPGESIALRLDAHGEASANRPSSSRPHPDGPWTEAVCHAINDYGSIDVFRSRLDGAHPIGD